MYILKYSGKIKKDIKLRQKRGYDFQLFEFVLEKLMKPGPLDIKNKDHDLRGEYKGFRECHISPDWLLIYRFRFMLQNFSAHYRFHSFHFYILNKSECVPVLESSK